MRSRWFWFCACAILALMMLVCGLLVPMHLRAVDASVVERAGRSGTALTEQGLQLAGEKKLGAAQMLAQAAAAEQLPGREKLDSAVNTVGREHPEGLMWGDDASLQKLFANGSAQPTSGPAPCTDFIVREANRVRALEHLKSSSSPAVQELLHCRALTTTVLLPPSQSASGQAFDTAVSICGLLLDGGHLTASLSNQVLTLASQANHGASSQPLEQVLLDVMSLGQRFSWDQLVTFVAGVPDATTLHGLAGQVRTDESHVPVLFAAVQLSGDPAGVARYVTHFKQTGVKDLGASLRYGAGGVNELLQRDRRLYQSGFLQRLTALNPIGTLFYSLVDYCFRMPSMALALKWFSYLFSGFFLAAAFHFARPVVSSLEQPLQVRGFHVVREFLFALGFLLVVLLLSEPFLAQENQGGGLSLRPHLSTVGRVAPAGIAGIKQTVMNPTIMLTLLLFFVLQALIYVACLVKLAEIRRQRVPPRMKLKLLENEDHLFDAGLYLGFVGTIISLIVASMGLIKFSLMAAYSSTSFGIVFVVIFKIFHLRPERRRLLLEAERENAPAETYTPAVASTSLAS